MFVVKSGQEILFFLDEKSIWVKAKVLPEVLRCPGAMTRDQQVTNSSPAQSPGSDASWHWGVSDVSVLNQVLSFLEVPISGLPIWNLEYFQKLF